MPGFTRMADIQHTVQVIMCVQKRFKSICTFSQSDQSLSFPPEEILDPWLPIQKVDDRSACLDVQAGLRFQLVPFAVHFLI